MDEYRVRMTAHARQDLDGIYDYIAVSHRAPDTALSLGVYANRGYRQLLVERYTVIYRVDDEEKQVIVVTVRYSPSNF